MTTPAEKLAEIGRKMDRKWHRIEPREAPAGWEPYPHHDRGTRIWTLISERGSDCTFRREEGPDGTVRYFQLIRPHGRRGERGYTTILNESLLVTRDEHAMLEEISSRYAYQPPAELVEMADALIGRGLVTVQPGFSCLILTNDGEAARHHGPASVGVYTTQRAVRS